MQQVGVKTYVCNIAARKIYNITFYPIIVWNITRHV